MPGLDLCVKENKVANEEEGGVTAAQNSWAWLRCERFNSSGGAW